MGHMATGGPTGSWTRWPAVWLTWAMQPRPKPADHTHVSIFTEATHLRRPAASAHAPHDGSLFGDRESILPWLAACVVVAGWNLAVVVRNADLTIDEWGALFLALAATVSATGLVAARSRAASEVMARDERARPAQEQLRELVDDAALATPGSPGYVDGMERWSTVLLELIEHARDLALDPVAKSQLDGAFDDTSALRDLLRSSQHRDLSLNEAATLHSVCSLWETDQERIELLAAEVDPRWHRRWRARTVVERRLRHGQRGEQTLVLPYRS